MPTFWGLSITTPAAKYRQGVNSYIPYTKKSSEIWGKESRALGDPKWDHKPIALIDGNFEMNSASKAVRFLVPLVLIGIAWLQELIDQVWFGGNWNLLMGGGYPWWGLFTAPFSHSGFGHLLSNTLLFLPLSWLTLLKGLRDYISVWACVLLVEIFQTFFWATPAHGMSGVVFGLLGYLLIIGFLEKRFLAIVLTIICFGLYGHFLPSLLPWNVPQGISWIGHFSGFVGGLIGALGIYREPDKIQ